MFNKHSGNFPKNKDKAKVSMECEILDFSFTFQCFSFILMDCIHFPNQTPDFPNLYFCLQGSQLEYLFCKHRPSCQT